MKRYAGQIFMLLAAVMLLSATFMENEAEARAGGSRSMGSRGSRSYSRPASPSQSSPYQQAAPAPSRPMTTPPFQQPAPAGGFLRSMAGGMVGGMLGGMLFRGMGFGGGMGGGGYGGPGIFDILLLAGIGYLIYRYVKKRRESQEAYPQQFGATDYQPTQVGYSSTASPVAGVLVDDLGTGLANVRQMDYSFDEGRFKDTVMDLFFRVQGAWMNRDLTPVISILTEEMRGVLQEDVQRLIRERRINRLENIAVRTVEITEAWQESGQDFITAQIYANLLDYTTDDAGQVVEGNRTDPVKFEEYWTFSRPVGPNQWKLSAIQQA